jgi:hypothetical protein
MRRDESGTWWNDQGQKIHPNDVKAYRRAERQAIAKRRRRAAAGDAVRSEWLDRAPLVNAATVKQPGRRFGPAPRPKPGA